MNAEINYLAVLLAAFSAMMIGYFWYGSEEFGFGGAWAKLAKIDLKKSSTPLAMASATISALVMAYGLAYAAFIANDYFQNSYLVNALQVGLFVWVCFQSIRMYQRARFNQESQAESVIHITNEFVTVMVMALIIGLIGI